MSEKTSSKLKVSDGDWICGNEKCANVNFARRSSCNKCGESKSISSQVIKQTGAEIGKSFASKSHGLFSAEDWQCGKCGNINWARRSTCNVCNAKKFGSDESRTGIGGGFNERLGVEYNQKEDSDGEYDEYGRKKKKFRKADAVKTIVTNAPIAPEENDDDDDDDVDVSKYALDEDDDEDDDDEDVSKYALDEDDEDDDDDEDVSKYALDEDDDDDDSKDESPKKDLKRPQSLSKLSAPKHKQQRRSRSRSRSSSSSSSDSSSSSSSSDQSESRSSPTK